MSGRGHGTSQPTTAPPTLTNTNRPSDVNNPAANGAPSLSQVAATVVTGSGVVDDAANDPAKLKAEKHVKQGHAYMRDGDLDAARGEYIKALGDVKGAMKEHLRAQTWPDAMIGLFSTSYVTTYFSSCHAIFRFCFFGIRRKEGWMPLDGSGKVGTT